MVSVYGAAANVADGYHLDSPAELFHENSKIRRLGAGDALTPEALHAMTHGYKSYSSSTTIALPAPRSDLGVDLGRAIRSRRSLRDYRRGAPSLAALATILHAAYGVSAPGTVHRSVPSGGGLFPLEVYVLPLDPPRELEATAYHYDVRGHALERVPVRGDVERIRSTVFVPEAAESAAVFFAISAVFGRGRIKYGERAYRFALMECGHVMQNLVLACGALGFGACPFGGFVDDDANELLGLDGLDESVLYLATVGAVPGTPATNLEES